jgi:tRNA threonylcarbamoyladenosine biosynthesis protein TsaE
LSEDAPGLTAAFASASEAETQELGAALGAHLHAGDIIALQGELGAGKTVFVKGIAAGVGLEPDEVTSPTFTLVHEYTRRPGGCPFFHVDLYRIERPEALEGIGWDEAVGGRGVAAIEWADRAGTWLPADRLEVHLAVTGESTRRIVVAAHGEGPRAHLRALLGAPPWASRRLPESPGGRKEDRGER